MFSKFFSQSILICFFCMFLLAGCKKESTFVVDTGTMGHEAEETGPVVYNDTSQSTSSKMTTLTNGVIVYKDDSHIKDIDANSKSIRFGPGNVGFQK